MLSNSLKARRKIRELALKWVKKFLRTEAASIVLLAYIKYQIRKNTPSEYIVSRRQCIPRNMYEPSLSLLDRHQLRATDNAGPEFRPERVPHAVLDLLLILVLLLIPLPVLKRSCMQQKAS